MHYRDTNVYPTFERGGLLASLANFENIINMNKPNSRITISACVRSLVLLFTNIYFFQIRKNIYSVEPFEIWRDINVTSDLILDMSYNFHQHALSLLLQMKKVMVFIVSTSWRIITWNPDAIFVALGVRSSGNIFDKTNNF